MGFSEFEFRPMGSFRYIGGVFGLESKGEASGALSVLDRWKKRMQIWVLR